LTLIEAAPRARPSPKLLIFFVYRAHVSAETSVVKTYSLVNGAFWTSSIAANDTHNTELVLTREGNPLMPGSGKWERFRHLGIEKQWMTLNQLAVR
jgi:hypothetical protein